MISFILGAVKFSLITFSSPLPIDTTKKTWGIIPISVEKKKFFTLTLNKVGKIQDNWKGIPPQNLYANK